MESAVDPHGDLYLAADPQVDELTQGAGTWIQLPFGAGTPPYDGAENVAVDASGDVYVPEGGRGKSGVQEFVSGASTAIDIFLEGLVMVGGIALGAGNVVYMAENNPADPQIVEQPTRRTAPLRRVPIALPARPYGLATDAKGDLYVCSGRVVIEWDPSTHHQVTLPTAHLDEPIAVAVDGQGDVYVVDMQRGAVLELVEGAKSWRRLPFTGQVDHHHWTADRSYGGSNRRRSIDAQGSRL